MHSNPIDIKKFCEWFCGRNPERPDIANHLAWCKSVQTRSITESGGGRRMVSGTIESYIRWMSDVKISWVPQSVRHLKIDERDISEMIDNCYKSIIEAKGLK